jgi:Leucine-rich repeat (LRR) protein
MANTTSPQAKGWAWVQDHPDIQDMPEWRQLQLMALSTFYFATQGESWGPSLSGWLNYSLNECFWSNVQNVQCYGARYIYLGLFNTSLDGTIPAEISLLTNLEHLNFEGNHLKSYIPTEIGLLTALNLFFASATYLTGTIPTELGQLVQLRDLSISGSSFTGSNLTGKLPTELGLLTASTLLLIGDLNLQAGAIPSEIGNLKELTRLSLMGNGLTNSLPSELGMLTVLTSLTIRNNDFTGGIPSQLGSLTLLTELWLHSNGLTKVIPTEIGQLSGLKQLYLSDNELVGPLPTQMAQLTQLETLEIHHNPSLTGTFPSSLCDLTTWQGGAIKMQCALIACPCGELCTCFR